MKSKPNRKPQINKGTRKSAFILSDYCLSAATHPAQAPLNQDLIHPESKIINFLKVQKIRLHGHCAKGLRFRKIETDKSRSENSPNSPRRINRYQSESPSNETDKEYFKNSPYCHYYHIYLTVFQKWQYSENPHPHIRLDDKSKRSFQFENPFIDK